MHLCTTLSKLEDCRLQGLLMAAIVSSSAVALDMSLSENSILELKLVAIQHLEYEEFLQLLGVTLSTNRYNLERDP